MRNSKRSSTVLDYAEMANTKLKEDSILLINEHTNSLDKISFENTLEKSNTHDKGDLNVSKSCL